MLTRLRGRRTSRDIRTSLRLAADLFPTCEAHRREAVAVHRALNQMRPSPIGQIDLNATIAECLPDLFANRRPVGDSLDVVEHQLAMEAETGSLAQSALVVLADESVMKPLLGPAADASHWDASTI